MTGVKILLAASVFSIASGITASAVVPLVVGQIEVPVLVQESLAESTPALYIYSGSMAGIVFMFLGALRYVINLNATTIGSIVKSHDKREDSADKVVESLNCLTKELATNSERMKTICQGRRQP
tara:strand:- start:2308 stop:2679 length:372 start_codon:yes stop_codon:yes gene_type:complete